ncbi:MAG TPA: glycosyltransferase family 87 protein [Blastocatellia bacterium]|nr:glycosyltransferase family 87 protein [Blastocatellia bacterium]
MKKARLFFIAIFVIAIALLGFVFIRNLIDFPVYYSAGQSLLNGRTDLYSPDFAQGRVMDYRYPPFFLLALVPLWLLPYKVAAYVWYLTAILQIAGCVFILNRQTNFNQSAKAAWLVVFLAVGQYFVMILHYGNAHLLAIFLVFASFYFFIQRKNWAAALAMALAITIKLTPILILPYFALKRKWKLLSLIAALLIAINIAPAVYFGFAKNAQLLKSWYEHVIAGQEFHEANGPINLSLKGQLRRYLSPIDYSQRIDKDAQYPQVNIATISQENIEKIWIALAGIMFFSTLALIWVGSKESISFERRVLLELSLMICLMLFTGPLTSKIYFIALLWPMVGLAAFAFNDSKPVRRVLIFVAVINSVLPLLPGRSVQRLLLVLGVDFYVNCLLAVAVVYALFYVSREPQMLSGEPQTQALPATKTS